MNNADETNGTMQLELNTIATSRDVTVKILHANIVEKQRVHIVEFWRL